MKNALLILMILFAFSSVGFAASALENLQFETGVCFSGGIVNFDDDSLTQEQQTGLGILSFLATSRASVLGAAIYPINPLFAVGGELEAGYLTVTVMDDKVSVLHLPIRVFARVHLGPIAIDPYIGMNSMINNFLSPSIFSNTVEYGVKLHLGKFFVQYGKERDLQNTIFDTKLTYTRIGAGYQFKLF